MKEICNIRDLNIQAILELGSAKPRNTSSYTHEDKLYYELIYYTEGIDIVEYKNERLETAANSIRFQPTKKKGEKYTISNVIPTKSVDIIFESLSPLPDYSLINIYDENNELKSLFKKAEKTWKKKETGYINKCNYIFYRILYLIEKYSEDLHPSYLKRISPAVEFIHAHYTDIEFPYSDMAKICNMSESYFRRIFFKCFKCSVTSYIKKLRIEYACEMLISEQKNSISEIAEKCGYENIFYFSRVFKDTLGISPSEYAKSTSKK